MLARSNLISTLFLVGLAISCNHASATDYSLPIHAFGVSDSIVKISVDDDRLVPLLMSTKLTDQNVEFILPYRGSAEAQEIKEALLNRTDLSLGSTALYFYAAINLAFDRIYKNLILFDRDISKELPGVTADGSRYKNLRRLAALKPINNATLNVDVYANRENFDKRAAEIGLHTPRAFWDPQSNTIGVYFDNRIFRWAGTQSAVVGQSEQEVAAHIRDYVSRRVIDTVSHELVHFIQALSGSPAARNPFFSELVAVFVQDNIYLREERALMAAANTARGFPLKPWLEPCAELWQHVPAWSVPILLRLAPAVRRLQEGKLSMENIINLNDSDFYSQAPEQLAGEYALLNPFGLFLMMMPNEEFEKRFSDLIDQQRVADVHGLDAGFRDFLKAHARPSDDATFRSVRDAVTYCLDEHDFISAHTGSLEMVELDPDNALGVIYMGDVFFNSINAYFTLDYYDMAYQMLRPETSAATRVMTISRLADAFEELGDVELSTSRLKEIEALDPDTFSIDTTMILLRSRLKLALYSHAEKLNKKPQEVSPLLVEMYMHAFQGLQCGSGTDKEAISLVLKQLSSRDEPAAHKTLRAHFEHVREAMLKELTESDWGSVLKLRLAMCH